MWDSSPGWGLGVDIAAVIVIFAVFKALRGIRLVKQEFGLMENTIMMSVAVAASWISSAGLVSAVPALTMLTGYQFVWWQLALFIGIVLYMGLFMAIPLKRQMIQIEPLRFPANIPTGETLKAMYSHGGEAMKKAKALGLAGVLGMLIAGLRDGLEWIPGQLNLGLSIGRIHMSKLTLSLEPSLIFIGIGALFGMKVGYSMLLGLILNYGVLAPHLSRPRSSAIRRPRSARWRRPNCRWQSKMAAHSRSFWRRRSRDLSLSRASERTRSPTSGPKPRFITRSQSSSGIFPHRRCRTARPIHSTTWLQ